MNHYPETLNNVFKNYFTALAARSESSLESLYSKRSSDAIVDCFAVIPLLESAVICWSNTGHSVVNRVFYDLKKSWIEDIIRKDSPSLIKVVARHSFREGDASSDNDSSLSVKGKLMEYIACIPVYHGNNLFAIIRLIGSRELISDLGYFDAGPSPKLEIKDIDPPADFDLVPHILGRWAGHQFNTDRRNESLKKMLNLFSTFFAKSHSMVYLRNFDNDYAEFACGGDTDTDEILHGLRAPLGSNDYMFSIVASQGASEVVDNFPEGLETRLRLNDAGWTTSDHFSKLMNRFEAKNCCYIGIPLKVDDAVLAVISILGPHDDLGFDSCYRFARSTLSEMGRAVDKVTSSQTARILHEHAVTASAQKDARRDLAKLGTDLVEQLVRSLLFFGKIEVGCRQVRLGAESPADEIFPEEVIELVERNLLLEIQESTSAISLHLLTKQDPDRAPRGLMLVPVPSVFPFLLYLVGPLALLKGRSLRCALIQIQSVLRVAFSESDINARTFDIANWKEHLALWARVHDLKNDTSRFYQPLQKLLAVSENGDHNDLIEECRSFSESFASTIREFEAECDQILMKSGVRSLSEVKLFDLVGDAWRGLAKKLTWLDEPPRGSYFGDNQYTIFTSENELRLVIENLLSNVFDHFARLKVVGDVIITTKVDHKGEMLTLKIHDTLKERGCVKKVKKILEDKDTAYTLGRFIKPVVEKVLYGHIWVESDPEYGSLCMCLQVPTKSKTR